MGKDILHRVGNGGHCGFETVSREVLPQVEIPEKWTQEPPCFAITISLVAYGSGKRMVTGTRAESRIKTRNFKRRFLPYHMSQRRDILCTNSPVVSRFNPKFVDRSVPFEAKQQRVKFRRCFGNIPLAECNVSVPNVRSSGIEPKAPVTDYRNRGSGNYTRG